MQGHCQISNQCQTDGPVELCAADFLSSSPLFLNPFLLCYVYTTLHADLVHILSTRDFPRLLTTCMHQERGELKYCLSITVFSLIPVTFRDIPTNFKHLLKTCRISYFKTVVTSFYTSAPSRISKTVANYEIVTVHKTLHIIICCPICDDRVPLCVPISFHYSWQILMHTLTLSLRTDKFPHHHFTPVNHLVSKEDWYNPNGLKKQVQLTIKKASKSSKLWSSE